MPIKAKLSQNYICFPTLELDTQENLRAEKAELERQLEELRASKGNSHQDDNSQTIVTLKAQKEVIKHVNDVTARWLWFHRMQFKGVIDAKKVSTWTQFC